LHDGQIGCLDKILFDFRINPSLRTSSEVPIFHMVHPLLLLFMLFNGLFQFFFAASSLFLLLIVVSLLQCCLPVFVYTVEISQRREFCGL